MYTSYDVIGPIWRKKLINFCLRIIPEKSLIYLRFYVILVDMTLMVFFGCAFIAFGPALALFSLTVAKDAQQVIVLIAR